MNFMYDFNLNPFNSPQVDSWDSFDRSTEEFNSQTESLEEESDLLDLDNSLGDSDSKSDHIDLTEFLHKEKRSNHEEVVKKLKSYRIRRLTTPFPRLVKSDIRQSYMAMHINAFNSSSHDLFKCFLERYCIKDCQFKILNSTHAPPRHLDTFTVNVQGIDMMLRFYSAISNKFPDLCAKYDGLRIKRRLDTRYIQLTSKMTLQGNDPLFYTRLLTLPNHPLTLEVTNTSNIEEGRRYLEEVGGLQFEGNVSLFIDENSMISGIYLS